MTKLDPQLLETANKCIAIHEKLDREGYGEFGARQFRRLKITNLPLYIAYLSHAIFESGMKDAVIVIAGMPPNLREKIYKTLPSSMFFTSVYGDDINEFKRKVQIEIFFEDEQQLSFLFGVNPEEAKTLV